MRYELNSTQVFDEWLMKLDGSLKRRLANRLLQVENGNLGDYKTVSQNLFELRCFFGGGLRLYCTIHKDRVFLLLVGGNKSSQEKDVAKAKAMLIELGVRDD